MDKKQKQVKKVHSHKKVCTHKSVEYCQFCKKVYCVDCDKEWGDNSGWVTTTYPGITGGTITNF